MSKSAREKPFHWGRPNPDYTGPEAASGGKSAVHLAAVEAARADFPPPTEPDIPEDPLGRMYDRSPLDPPEFPDTDDDYDPSYAAEYARQALGAAAVHQGLSDPSHLRHGDTGSDGRAVVMDFDRSGELVPVGYGTFNDRGRLHSAGDEPALVRLNGTLEWFRDGVLHRDGGPAVRYADPATGQVREAHYRHGVHSDDAKDVADPSESDVNSQYAEHLERIGL